MLAVFALRLAAGMMACLLLLPAKVINPRFFRTHFLTAFALGGLSLACVRDSADWWLLTCLGAALVLSFVGSMVWGLEGAPGGRAFIALTTVALASSLVCLSLSGIQAGSVSGGEASVAYASGSYGTLLGDATSAAVLGAAVTAMLLGHSYLIAPTMSLTPLLRLLAVLAVAVLSRLAVDGYALGCWTAIHSFVSLKSGDAVYLLPLRWLVGFVAPLGLDWMAWQAARIRSTQSATGILYVVVIFCFLGELTSLLLRSTGMTF
ncbi:MAG TPA: hypothetical protein VH592_16925 [Gemmataceae bacterium]